jgi:hypothetical protein
MARLPLSEFIERLLAAEELLREEHSDNPAIDQMCEAIEVARDVILHISVPFQNIVEEKLDISQ